MSRRPATPRDGAPLTGFVNYADSPVLQIQRDTMKQLLVVAPLLFNALPLRATEPGFILPSPEVRTAIIDALKSEIVSVTRSTDARGRIISALPQKINVRVPVRWDQSEPDWAASVFTEALSHVHASH